MEKLHPIHVCIGMARSGTTWLFEALSASNSIFMPPAKEVRYWWGAPAKPQRLVHVNHLNSKSTLSEDDARWLDRWAEFDMTNPSRDGYIKLISQDDRPSFDISPAYASMNKGRMLQLRDALPEGSKILLLLRNPTERIASEIKLHAFLHGRFRGPAADATIAEYLRAPEWSRGGQYVRIIDAWKEVFGDAFKYFLYDDIESRPDEFLRDVVRFLDLKGVEEEIFTRHQLKDYVATERNQPNSGIYPTLTSAQLEFVAQVAADEIRQFEKVDGDVANKWLSKTARQSSAPRSEIPEVTPEESRYLRLLRLTESLGDNCEFGFVQRFEGYEPSSLFRWAVAPAERVVSYLGNPVALMVRENLRCVDSDLVADVGSGFFFHSDLIVNSNGARKFVAPELFDSILAKEYQKIEHLAFKFWHFSVSRPGIYVLKCNSGVADDVVSLIAAELSKRNAGHKLLYVSAGGDAGVEKVAGNIYSARIPEFASYLAANKVDLISWRKILYALLQYNEIQEMVDGMFV